MSTPLLCRSLVLAALAMGCAAAEVEPTAEPPRPVLLALSTSEVAVGQPLEFLGGGFVTGKGRYTAVRFGGRYISTSGVSSKVDFRFRPHWADGNRLVWANVGPFMVPFGAEGDRLGVFEGTVEAVNVMGQDREAASAPLPVHLTMKPSLLIRDFQPTQARCEAPTKRLLGGFPYKIAVEAVGFTPANFSYTVNGEPSADRPRIIRRPARGRLDVFGEDGQLVFEPVPDDQAFYLVNFAVTSLDTSGREHGSNLLFAVHRPLEYIRAGEVQVAEIEAPTPDSGCMQGGDSLGRTVTYTQSKTDTRTRSVTVNWNETWLRSHSGTYTQSHGESNGVNLGMSQSNTEGWTANWSYGSATMVGGGASIPLLGSVQASETLSIGYQKGKNGSHSEGWTVGRDYSTNDTESWAFSDTQSRSLSGGTADFWSVSSATATSLAFSGQILPGEYGVFYRQTTRLAYPGAVVAYNLCGTPEIVAQTNLFDYTWSVELAQGPACPPFPLSSLPKAQCLIAPCSSPE